MPTFLYCIAIVALLWVVGIVFAWQPLEAWGQLSTWIRVTTMCLVLAMITALSLFPALVYAAFNWREKERARTTTLLELNHYKMGKELKDEANMCFETIYRPESYKVPVPLATLAIMVGWGLFFFYGGAEAVANLAKSGNIYDFFISLKDAHPVVFGFLGAFFFSLHMLFQRYVTSDLKASLFMHIAVRIWVVMILTLVLSVVWHALSASEATEYQGRPALLAVCFIAGITPDVALDLIQKAARAGFGKLPRVTYNHIPLSKIQGLNLWHQARLAEEGIDSVQNLAMSDIIGLIVNTRLGLMRLLHWVDQALLCIYVGQENLEKFRKAGIYTATNFESIYMGRLLQQEKGELERAHQPKLEERTAEKGQTYIPAVPRGLIKSLGEVEELGNRERKELVKVLKKDKEIGEPERNKLIKALGTDEGFEERLRNIMIAICEDESFQLLRKMLHGQLQ